MNITHPRNWVGRRHCLTAITAALMPLSVLAPALAQESPRYDYGGHMWDGGWWMFLGPIWMILFLGILVALVVLLVRWLSGPGVGGTGLPATKAPLDILADRFARGEIDKDEFEERKRALGG